MPIGLAYEVPLLRDVSKGQVITWPDVRVDDDNEAVKIRRQMERRFAPQTPATPVERDHIRLVDPGGSIGFRLPAAGS